MVVCMQVRLSDLPSLEGWKTELSLVVGYIRR